MYNQSKHKERKHFYMYCLQCFSSERILANHINNCLTINGAQAINMPKQGENILKFNNFHKQLPVPFVIYADFEAIRKKVQGCEQSEEMKNEKNRRSYREAYQTHEDCGYGYKVVCCYDDNLLLIKKDEKKYYILIKDFNAFMYNQSKHKERKHFCMYCLQCFSSERILANHVNNCLTINGAQAINMPKQGENILKFNNFHKQLPVPFVIYADFEAITKNVQGCEQSEEMKNEKNKRSYTEAYQTHEVCGYGYKVVCCYDDKYSSDICIYRGENAVYGKNA